MKSKILDRTYSFTIFISIILFLSIKSAVAQSVYSVLLDTVKAQKFDMGKMWTFEEPPLEYFKSEYNFAPDTKWLDKMQKSALKLGGGCSASFVSEDGLIMTNHHCIRGILPSVEKDNENILKNGFLASSINEERRINNLKVEQLIILQDVTDLIDKAISVGNTEDEIISLREKEINKIISEYQKKFPDLVFNVTSLYNGGKYSLYGNKVYDDIRLVFVPELSVAKLGGDYDNFTYPRYGLDCAFLRAYENGKPVKTEYFFKWSNNVVKENDLVFVVGYPGSSDRLNTIDQIEFERDFRYPIMVDMLKDLYKVYDGLVKETNAEDFKLIARLFTVGNALKVYEGTYRALLDPILIARKKDFENNFKAAVISNNKLNSKYGNLWNEISSSVIQLKNIYKKLFAYNISNFYSPQYLIIASKLINLINDINSGKIKAEDFKAEAEKLYPNQINHSLQKRLLSVQLNIWQRNLNMESELVKIFFTKQNMLENVEELLNKSWFSSKEKFQQLITKPIEEILKENDPFIIFITSTKDEFKKISEENKKINQRLSILNQNLGKALYQVYGNSIPPDATGTLRLADGIVKGYNYNGTIAPIKTTFYGALDRYFSFDKKFPFSLPAYWENLPKEFDLSTPLNFISTNDIIGGNSGSAVLNKNAEVVGLAFDGNIESLPNTFIYTTEANRTVSVATAGMYNAIKYIYKATNLSEELINGKLVGLSQ